ncbi:MAG: zinc ribbon domain-containing protein [Planctomycetota bacterium]
MHQEVEKLLTLQRLDDRLEILRKEITQRPKTLAALEKRVTEAERQLGEAREKKKQAKMAIDRLDLEIATLSGKTNESRTRLNQAKNDTEYKALEHQINRFGRENAAFEEQQLIALEQLEKANKLEQDLVQYVAECMQVLEEECARFDADKIEIKAEAEKLLPRRASAASQIDAAVLSEYTTMFPRFRERSVVSAEGGVCGGCNISLSPQSISLLRQGEYVKCGNCTRILYL